MYKGLAYCTMTERGRTKVRALEVEGRTGSYRSGRQRKEGLTGTRVHISYMIWFDPMGQLQSKKIGVSVAEKMIRKWTNEQTRMRAI